MATRIIMPKLGESVVDGTVGEWLKQIGDTVEEYESIVRISTDKVDTEIPAPASGILLAIHVQEGETVDSGALLGLIGEKDEAHAEETNEPSAPVSAQSEATNGHHQKSAAPRNAMKPTGAHITPVVARMAAEHELDLDHIEGSGRQGRITKKDVLAYLEAQPEAESVGDADLPPWEQPGTGDLFKSTVDYEQESATAKPAAAPAAAAPAPPRKAPTQPEAVPTLTDLPGIPGELQALSAMRRRIAEHMVHSKLETAPHVTTVFEVDMSAVLAHREAHRDDYARQGQRLTLTPYFVAACVHGLQQQPGVNARWTDRGIYRYHTINIGIAVALEDGLIVPVIHNAQDYNLMGLARKVNDLAERARQNTLRPDEVRDGTFTLTNHGVSGSLFATPIINQPQSAILGVGTIEKRVKVIQDAIAIRPCAYLSLTFDHRILDGATADAFMQDVKLKLENWVN